MKNKKMGIVLIILLIILCIGLITFMINVINGKFKFSKFSFSKESNELVLDEIYDVHIKNINIDMEAGNIYIKQSDKQEIKVMIYGYKENTNVQTSDNELSITSKGKKCTFLCFNNTISKIEIYLPSDYENNINITSDYGNIEIGEFGSANIDIEADCGNVEVTSGNVVNITNDFGNISLDKANKATINESAGDINIGEVNDVTAENSYGKINIKKINNYLDVSNDCGDINIDKININKNSSIKSDLGKVKINEINEIYVDATTDLGKVKINKNYQKSDITLTIENDCGDIIVNN